VIPRRPLLAATALGLPFLASRGHAAMPDDAPHPLFRIRPVRDISALRAEALAATPPHETGSFRAPDLVDLATLAPKLRLDVRYATANNFMGEAMYTQARAFLQRPAAEALARAHARVMDVGYGLVVFDGYRPWYVTKMFWDATPADKHMFVANPAEGSRHNRGCAVDLSLYDLRTGHEVVMPSGFDEMTPRAYADAPDGSQEARRLRGLLRIAMETEGFAVLHEEWWHFDHADWQHYAIMNEKFEDIG